MWICLEVAVSIAILAPSVALADRWSPLQAASYKPGLAACQTEGDRTACIVVRCDQLEGLQILVFDDGEGGAIADQLTFKVGAWTGQTTFERMENGDLKRRLALTSPLLAQPRVCCSFSRRSPSFKATWGASSVRMVTSRSSKSPCSFALNSDMLPTSLWRYTRYDRSG